jgi:RNA polymerase sigma-70 factor (ECF subfamily)
MLSCQKGDLAAFDRLVALFRKEVMALGYRFGLDAERAEDIAQETFIRVYKARASYQPTARFRSWLLRIASNLIVSEARSRRRSRTYSLDRAGPRGAEDEGQGPGEGLADPRAVPPTQSLERAELGSVVEEAMQSLPENQRVGLILNRFHEQSYEEVGAALGLSLEAVKSLLFRARQGLKTRLLPYLEEDLGKGAGEGKKPSDPRRV